jgi:hypothetical protein
VNRINGVPTTDCRLGGCFGRRVARSLRIPYANVSPCASGVNRIPPRFQDEGKMTIGLIRQSHSTFCPMLRIPFVSIAGMAKTGG